MNSAVPHPQRTTKRERLAKLADGWREYEARKSAWIACHPEAKPDEYTKAMTRLARDCGV